MRGLGGYYKTKYSHSLRQFKATLQHLSLSTNTYTMLIKCTSASTKAGHNELSLSPRLSLTLLTHSNDSFIDPSDDLLVRTLLLLLPLLTPPPAFCSSR